MGRYDLFTLSFRVDPLALGQSYDCPSASEVTLKYMGKIDLYLTTKKHEPNAYCMEYIMAINYRYIMYTGKSYH